MTRATKLALALILVVGLGIGGTAGKVSMPEGVSEGENSESPRPPATVGRLGQGTPETAYRSVPDDGRNALGETGLDVLFTPSPVPEPEPTDGPEPTLPAPTADAAAVHGAATGPSPAPERAEPQPEPAAGTAVETFLAGYRAGGGDPAWEEHLVNDVIPCESGWQLDSPGIYYGLAQFAPGTWANAARPGADYRDAYEQGWAVASWMSQIPGRWGTSAGWPNCWWT